MRPRTFFSLRRWLRREPQLPPAEVERRHALTEPLRALIHGPPFTDAEREQALAEVEARRK